MERVACWSILISADRYQAERLYQRDSIVLAGIDSGPESDRLAVGDRVLLVAATDPPLVFASGTVSATHRDDADADPDDADSPASTAGEIAIRYATRLLDAPRSAPDSLVPGGAVPGRPATVAEIDETVWRSFSGAGEAETGGDVPTVRTWLVSLDLPIEANTAAEAVRRFWTYVTELGPRELPAFVSPAGDELAMQAMIAGVEVNLDPEEDGE
jgi:hypothetical protein